jgi:hypothetical protein
VSAEELRRLDDDALGRALGGLDLRWPTSPEVTSDVLATIRAAHDRPALRGVPRLGLPSRRRAVLLIAAALLALAAAAGAAKLLFDLGAVTVEQLPGRPTSLPGATFPGDDLGTRVTRAEAEAKLGTDFLTPPALGEPDVFWLQEPGIEEVGGEPWVAAAWLPSADLPPIDDTRWGAVLIRFRGEADVASKQVTGSGSAPHPIEVDGRRGLWLTGTHELVLPVDDAFERFTVRGNVLLLQDGEDTLRLETALPRPRAIALVRSIL